MGFLVAASGISASATATSSPVTSYGKIDWSFLDAAFMITCPQKDGSNPRLERVMEQLQEVGLSDRVEVREFAPDDKDRVRGCYVSHITVLEEAARRFEGRSELAVLVLEDNLEVSPRLAQSTLDAVSAFITARNGGAMLDMVHLAYIMYVPGLSVETVSSSDSLVKLKCNADSVLGTSAYIVTASGLAALLEEHAKSGYVDAIPNMMARRFPDSRFAAYPMPFHRAATVKSLVNSQLDNLRALIFQAPVYTRWEQLLVSSGLSTNLLFPTLCVALMLGALSGGAEATSALFAARRGEDVNLVLPLLSAVLSTACLAVLGYGLALAPPPQTAQEEPKPRRL
jgi:hypothetical protein